MQHRHTRIYCKDCGKDQCISHIRRYFRLGTFHIWNVLLPNFLQLQIHWAFLGQWLRTQSKAIIPWCCTPLPKSDQIIHVLLRCCEWSNMDTKNCEGLVTLEDKCQGLAWELFQDVMVNKWWIVLFTRDIMNFDLTIPFYAPEAYLRADCVHAFKYVNIGEVINCFQVPSVVPEEPFFEPKGRQDTGDFSMTANSYVLLYRTHRRGQKHKKLLECMIGSVDWNMGECGAKEVISLMWLTTEETERAQLHTSSWRASSLASLLCWGHQGLH